MKKSATFLALFVVPTFAVAVAFTSCAGGESTNIVATGGSNGSGTGGRTGGGSGGFTSGGSGGIVGGGTGGFTSTSTGGRTGTGGFTGGGSGGFTGGGTGGVVGGGTGGAVVAGGGLTVTGGFATNGTWMGYGYTSTFPATSSPATVMPVCPTPCYPTTNTQLCASGMVPPDTTFASGALLGWAVNQAMATTSVSPPIGSFTTTGTGLLINVSGSVTGLRAQIKNAAGTTWCYSLTTSGTTMIPWGMFNTMCYNLAAVGAAAYTVGTPITDVQVVVPSSATTTNTFSFCMVDAHQY
jgi:hypothetical protein